jgi:threonine/homoserine/homoserine lactone efflux protein
MGFEFYLTCLVLVLTPGTGMIYTFMCALSQGRRGAILGALGSTFSILPHILAAILGLAAVLHASAVAFQAIKWIGVAYLLYIGWKTWKDTNLFDLKDGVKQTSSAKLIWQGVLGSVLNPKLSLFFMALLPQFVNVQSTNPMGEMALLGGIFMAMTFVAFAGLGVMVASARHGVQTRPKLLEHARRGFGGVFILLGARLALVER